MSEQSIQDAYAFCPRCGVAKNQIGSIPFRCDSCNLVLFLGPVAAVGGLVVNEDNELLMVRRARQPGLGRWGLPGGFVDRNETVEVALHREVREETNLSIQRIQFLMSRPNQYAYAGVVSPVIDFFFECVAVSIGELKLAEDELDFHQWVRPQAEHLENMAFESNRIAVECWLAATR
ncbi:Bifunctional NMN adenylyltransferase/Nudix hydrolase [Rubripirellula tenax]|uniref:Bifunctional NMN adenylyltransferase/Nudix hydrolase n=1 Tax=Rubripirellula tenax TaxID=2528015 RepID=A0A5C6EIM5_9BACT|nr:NUDIX domain-containing protein [Rubripirellula tenax]TWU47491.1 Bifunctional NMN adenylyltransferase/Nudix hydrolase [Rubripirellula tenax]